jgi:CRP-like cAMP-binding protein
MNIFQGFSMVELERIGDDIPVAPVGKGKLVASPHDSQGTMYLVKSGAVRLYTLTEGGKEFTVDVLTDGDMFGDTGSFTMESGTFAVALEESIICKWDYERFTEIIREKPELAIKYIEMISVRLREVEELLEYMAYSNVKQRLLFLLYKLSLKFGVNPGIEDSEGEAGWVKLDVDVTHQELASMAGSIRETVTEMLSQFAAEGIIRKTGYRKPMWIQTERLLESLKKDKENL